MIAWQEKEGHIELCQVVVDFLPPGAVRILVRRFIVLIVVSLDEIAEAGNELWLQQVDHLQRRFQDTGSASTGVVGYKRELELIGVVLEIEMGIGA
jgi:hypothetical protein